MMSVWTIYGSRHQQGRYEEHRLWSSNGGSSYKSDEVETNCSCCSSRILCLRSHTSDISTPPVAVAAAAEADAGTDSC